MASHCQISRALTDDDHEHGAEETMLVDTDDEDPLALTDDDHEHGAEETMLVETDDEDPST